MKVLIFGANGMLGHKLYERLKSKFEIIGTIRGGYESIERFSIFSRASIIENIEVTNPTSVREIIKRARPDCIINAVGITKQRGAASDVIATLAVNSLFPRQLAEIAKERGTRLISVSTDCVFDGTKGNYSEEDTPTARDLYGMSKLLGELNAGNTLTLRTSIIGRELESKRSLVEWFLSNSGGQVNGFRQAVYSGLPTIVLADLIADIISDHRELTGLYHVSGDRITKFDLLKLLNQHFDAGIDIVPDDEIVLDRSLVSLRFRSRTGFRPQPWPDMIEQMAKDNAAYRKKDSC